MTVMAAEAAEGAGARAGAARAGSARGRGTTRTVERRREPIDSERGGTRYLTTTTTQRDGRTQRRVTERRREPGQAPGSTIDTTITTNEGQAPTRRERASAFSKEHIPKQKISRTNYQPVILMEFVGAILLTAMTPVATKKDSQGLSPYAGADIVKLAAITVVYLILAMMSVGGRSWGRVAAWLGGLILLTDGLFEAANIAQDLQVFTGGGEPKTKAKAGA